MPPTTLSSVISPAESNLSLSTLRPQERRPACVTHSSSRKDTPRHCGARTRGGGGGLGRSLLLRCHLCRRDGDLRPVGRDGGDGDGDGACSAGRDPDSSGPPPPLETRPRDDDAGSPFRQSPRFAGGSGCPRRRRLLEGWGADGPQGQGGAVGREPGDTDRPVERRALQLRGRTLPYQGDDFLASSDPEAAYPDLGGRCVAQQEVHEPGAALRWPARLHHSRGGHTRGHPGDEGLRRGEQGGGRYLRYRVGGCDVGRRPGAGGLYGTPLSRSGRDVVDRVLVVAAQLARRPAPPYRAGAAAHRALKRRDPPDDSAPT